MSTRIRITFSKSGPLIFIGNLDLLTTWERAARRAGISLAYSQGFHPQPKMQLAAPLPLGFSSRCELLDVRINEEVDEASLAERLQAALPAGIRILDVQSVDPAAAALPAQVESAEYVITIAHGVEASEIQRRIETVLAAASLPRERRGKNYDLRPLIEGLSLTAQQGEQSPRLHMRLAAREGATGRPDEVLDALGMPRAGSKIERTALVLLPQQAGAQPSA